MSVAIEIETNAGAIAVRYDQASAVFAQTLLRTMRQIERELKAGLRASIRATLNRRTGLMQRRVQTVKATRQTATARGWQVKDEADIELRVRSTAWYAPGHEEGAVRVPTSGAAHLAIPLLTSMQEARAFGEGKDASNRLKARDVIAAPGRYGFSGTFTRDGIIFGRLLDHDQIVPMFALRRSITLRARRPHRLAKEVMAPRVRELLGAAATEATQALTAGQEPPA